MIKLKPGQYTSMPEGKNNALPRSIQPCVPFPFPVYTTYSISLPVICADLMLIHTYVYGTENDVASSSYPPTKEPPIFFHPVRCSPAFPLASPVSLHVQISSIRIISQCETLQVYITDDPQSNVIAQRILFKTKSNSSPVDCCQDGIGMPFK